MKHKDVFGSAEVAGLLGMHRNGVLAAIAGGRLVARPVREGARGPGRQTGREPKRYTIHRDDLVRFLLRRGDSLASVRRLFPSPDAVALVRTPGALEADLGPLMPTIACNSLFDLGRLVEARMIWGAVFNLPELGTIETAAAMRDFHGQADRPDLIALLADEGVRCLPSPIPFDSLLGAGTSAKAVARAVVRLRQKRR